MQQQINLAARSPEGIETEELIEHNVLELAGLLVFLFAAMTCVDSQAGWKTSSLRLDRTRRCISRWVRRNLQSALRLAVRQMHQVCALLDVPMVVSSKLTVR